MPERFNRSLLGIVRRDRNHPCVALWYFLNETPDGPVFRQAVKALPAVRKLDASRVCLLSSGRWDKDWSLDSLSRPGSRTWDTQLGDIHNYLPVPHRAAELSWLRGDDGQWKDGPTILSEYGIASALDLPTFARNYERLGATRTMDALYYRTQLDKFMADWRRWRLDEVFGRPEDYFKACLVANAEQRRLGMNAIRANPHLVGYSMTALHDEVSCGEGPITFFRDLKPGAVDAIRTGFAPLKWNLFVEPWHVYQGGSVHAEVSLANEDALPPGDYQVEVALFGPGQEALLRETVPLRIAGTEQPFALPVWKRDVKLDGPAGTHRLTATFVAGAAAVDGEAVFQVSDTTLMPPVNAKVNVWGDDPELAGWLKAQGIACHPFALGAAPEEQDVILACGKRVVSPELLQEFSRRVERGATALMLTPAEQLDREATTIQPRWTAFWKFARNAPEPEPEHLTHIPGTLRLGDVTGRRQEVEMAGDGRGPDLSPLWGGVEEHAVAYVYVPFEIRNGGYHMLWFGADYWYKAWVDGKVVSDTLDTGNGGPPADLNHHALCDLKPGAHLLVVKIVSGSGGCRLRLGGATYSGTDAMARFQRPAMKSLDVVSGFYHRDDWARRHPLFDGLPTGLLDWATYRNVIPQGGSCFQGLDEPAEVVCGAIQTCYKYNSGSYLSIHTHGKGRIVLSCLELIPNLGKDPVAERLLRNLLNYGRTP
jgi:hypothetical protein